MAPSNSDDPPREAAPTDTRRRFRSKPNLKLTDYRQVPAVSYLHSMEHGAVVVQYDPDLSQDQVEDLEEIGRSIVGEIIVAPRPGNPAGVAPTSWTKKLLLDTVDAEVISGFEREFGNRSPESGAQCPFQVDEGT